MKNIRKMYTYAFFSNLTFELVIWMLYLKHMGWSVGQIAMLQLVINIVQVSVNYHQVSLPIGWVIRRP